MLKMNSGSDKYHCGVIPGDPIPEETTLAPIGTTVTTLTEDPTITETMNVPVYQDYVLTITSFPVYTTSVVTSTSGEETTIYTTSEKLYQAYCPSTRLLDASDLASISSRTRRQSLFASPTQTRDNFESPADITSGIPRVTDDSRPEPFRLTGLPTVLSGPPPTPTTAPIPTSSSVTAAAPTTTTATGGAERAQIAGLGLLVVMGAMGVGA